MAVVVVIMAAAVVAVALWGGDDDPDDHDDHDEDNNDDIATLSRAGGQRLCHARPQLLHRPQGLSNGALRHSRLSFSRPSDEHRTSH